MPKYCQFCLPLWISVLWKIYFESNSHNFFFKIADMVKRYNTRSSMREVVNCFKGIHGKGSKRNKQRGSPSFSARNTKVLTEVITSNLFSPRARTCLIAEMGIRPFEYISCGEWERDGKRIHCTQWISTDCQIHYWQKCCTYASYKPFDLKASF